MPEPIISVSGLRGIVGESLTPEVAARYVAAFADTLAPGPIVVTRDGRANGPPLAEAVQAAVMAAGRDCLAGDVAATPTTGVLVREHNAAGGIQISASHNPAEYNGLKLFSAEGCVVSAGAGKRVLDRYRSGRLTSPPVGKPGTTRAIADTTSAHLRRVLATVDVAAIRRRKFTVLLDANHGSGAVLGRRLLDELGCVVTILGESPDGLFAHPPEPTAENLIGVCDRVRQAGADVGFCQDPDADRLALVDERGTYVGEEYTLALCANHVLAANPQAVVINCSTSRMTEDVAIRHKVPLRRSAVGEANVVEEMVAHNAAFGGEGNGGVIDPRVGYVRDSFVGMALVLDALAAADAPLGALVAKLPRYEIVKTKIELRSERLAAGLSALKAHFADAAMNALDGLRFDWPGKWLLVRASNTEPIVRAIAEAPTAAEAQRLCEESARVLDK